MWRQARSAVTGLCRPGSRLRKRAAGQRGMTLIEVLVALAILGLVSVALLGGLGTALSATQVADEQSTAQSVAEMYMEYVISQPFCANVTGNEWDFTVTTTTRSAGTAPDCWWDPANNEPPLLPDEYAGYSVEAGAQPYDNDGDGTVDEGARNVTITVKHNGETIFSVADYKVDR